MINYLEVAYGRDNCGKIYAKVKELDNKLSGKIITEKYINELKEWMTIEEIKKDLHLFITLLKVQQTNTKD